MNISLLRPCLYTSLVMCLMACKQAFEYSPNEVRLPAHDQNLNLKAITRLQKELPGDTLSFALIGDTQRFYTETEDFVSEINKNSRIRFVALAGDITDFGLQHEAIWVNSRLQQLKVPYIAVIGNHDMLANGRLLFKKMYGPENFSFQWGSYKFIGLNTNSQEVAYNGTIPDMPWLEKELQTDATEGHVVVISHMPPFDAGFDKRNEEAYARLLARHKPQVLSLHGHQHTASRSRPYNDGVEYVVTGSAGKRSYYIISLFKNGYAITERAF